MLHKAFGCSLVLFFCFQELIGELQAVEADIAFANVGSKAEDFSSDPLPELWPPSLPPPPQRPSTIQRAKASPPSLLPPRRDHEEAKHEEKRFKQRKGGSGLRVAEQRGQQRQRHCGIHFSDPAERVSLRQRARVELESGGGDGIRRRRSSGGRAGLTETKRTAACVVARAERNRVDCCCIAAAAAAGAGRRTISTATRRTRTPTSGHAPAQVHKAKKRRQISGNVLRRGGGCRGDHDDLGRTRRASTSVSFSSRNTSKRIVGSGVDRKLQPAAVVATAVPTYVVSSSANLAPRLSSPLGISRTVRPKKKTPAATHKAVLRRPTPVVEVASAAVARFGAPTMASSGKDRRQKGLVTSGVQSGPASQNDGVLLRGGARGRCDGIQGDSVSSVSRREVLGVAAVGNSS